MTACHIDSHQHFWLIKRGDYDWLTPALEPIYRDFLPEDLAPLLAKPALEKTVAVQAAPTVAETEYLLMLAESTDFIAGVVGWIDMEAEDAIDTLARLANSPYLKGIRPMIQDIDDPQWMLRPQLDPVFKQLIDSGLCFDALVKPIHLPHLLTLLQRYPDLKTVIDHGAKPDIAHQGFADWAPGISAIAEQTQAYCKLSGLLTEAQPGAGYDELAPYMQHLLDSFGTERLMWGSDWPVLNLANDYPGWLAITQTFLQPLDTLHKTQIMGANAARFYTLS